MRATKAWQRDVGALLLNAGVGGGWDRMQLAWLLGTCWDGEQAASISEEVIQEWQQELVNGSRDGVAAASR